MLRKRHLERLLRAAALAEEKVNLVTPESRWVNEVAMPEQSGCTLSSSLTIANIQKYYFKPPVLVMYTVGSFEL